MRNPLTIIFLLGFISRGVAQVNDTVYFQNEREMMEFAFQNTDLQNLTDGLFLNYHQHVDTIESFFDTIKTMPHSGNYLFDIQNIISKSDIFGNFDQDSAFNYIFEHISTLDKVRKMRVPIVLYDVTYSKLNTSANSIAQSWASSNPFPQFISSQLEEKDFFYGAAFFDSIPYNNVVLYFDEKSIHSNSDRSVQNISISVGTQQIVLYPGDEFPINNITSFNNFTFEVNFNDGSSESFVQNIGRFNSALATPVNFFSFAINPSSIQLNDNLPVSVNNPEIKYAIKYGCAEGVLTKPYYVVAGWGTMTNSDLVNMIFDWPSNIIDFGNAVNTEGFLENLHDAGYDIILVKFYPPNASIRKNSQLLERLINQLNEEKMANGSYEENIIMGLSAGALCIKHTLLQMEKKHIETGAPHHHSKLFVSYEGENGGANIPLGIQHEVKWLYENRFFGFTPYLTPNANPGAAVYALNYILNAPLSSELLKYFYTETGNESDPGQGSHYTRYEYLQEQVQNNHAYNSHIPGYPSFTRNISISNGSSEPNINIGSGYSDHFPYEPESGMVFYKQWDPYQRWEIRLLSPGVDYVFAYWKQTFFGNWYIKEKYVTSQPLMLDNAPGGTMFITSNPQPATNKLMSALIIGSPEINKSILYSFTPTLLTHDIKNFDPYANGGLGYLKYNIKVNGLNYDNLFSAQSGLTSNASNGIGYPHLYYPTNHYSVTPFDALFTWNENTEHVTGARAQQAVVGGEDYFVPVSSPVQGTIKNFMVDEGDHFNMFLQNRIMGLTANSENWYKADYRVDNEILIGKNVTERTDFLPYEINPYADIDAMAGSSVHITDGFHTKSGSKFHAHIGLESCPKTIEIVTTSTNDDELYDAKLNRDLPTINHVLLVPNPTQNGFKVITQKPISDNQIDLQIFDLSGNLCWKSSTENLEIIHANLKVGIYIVKLKIDNQWYTEKLIIQ